MRDVGLTTGVKTLWEEGRLYDYTITVQGQQFKAHKVVLASVSNYFKVVLNEDFMERNMDQIELKGLNGDIVSTVLKFIYTGDENILGTDVEEFLRCAMYLQIDSLAQVCVEKMLEGLNYKTCLEYYSLFIECSLQDAVERVESFIKKKWQGVLEVCNLKELSILELQVLRKYWKKSEWEMFLLVKNWFEADPENREDKAGELFCDIRFCLISKQKLTSITMMSAFSDMDRSWKDLVNQALQYHQLPTHLKVLEQSDQSKVRTEPSPAFFMVKDPSTFYALDEEHKWRKFDKKAINNPVLEEGENAEGIAVNNYFIVGTAKYGAQKWHIFDPRTLSWSKMADMEKYRSDMVILYHGEHLYLVGGSAKPLNGDGWVSSYEIDHYSFREDAWSLLAIPYCFSSHGACILGDELYVSGGHIEHVNGEKSPRSLYSLNLSSLRQEWKRKANFTLWESLEHHKMVVVQIDAEDVLLVVQNDMYMHYYSPSKDQWFKFDFDYTGRRKFYESYYSTTGLMPAQDNYLYVLNVMLFCYCGDESDPESDEEANHMKDRSCLKWKISKTGKDITNIPVGKFPVPPIPSNEPAEKYCAGLLAIPL